MGDGRPTMGRLTNFDYDRRVNTSCRGVGEVEDYRFKRRPEIIARWGDGRALASEYRKMSAKLRKSAMYIYVLISQILYSTMRTSVL